MRRLAEDLFQLHGLPPNAINVYLLDDVLIDAGTRWAQRRILRQLRGRPVSAHVLTHAHPDHQGASHAVCEVLGVPLWCSEPEREAVQAGAISGNRPRGASERLVAGLATRLALGRAHPVARTLGEGDEVAGFSVLETPGHAPGHISLWRERDRVLIVGDVLTNMSLSTGIPGLHEPPAVLSHDPPRNRESARRLAALHPRLACFGHGPPLRDPDRLTAFAAVLPR